MKLFKKLAAAALAAVLALSMVGCGATKGITAKELLNLISDSVMGDVTIEQSNDMERLAEKLTANIDKAENKEATVTERLTDPKVVAAADIDAKKEVYMVCAAENYVPKSPYISDEDVERSLVERLMRSTKVIGNADSLGEINKAEAGIATVKIDGKEYFVMVLKPVK
jgi:hypothetical protein